MPDNSYFPFNAATLDLRFDHDPNDVNRLGQKVNSLENVKQFLDHIKTNGFDTVMLVTNVPVNAKTGLVDTTADPGETWEGMLDRGHPDDLWKIAQYAEKIGLKTHLQLEIVDHLTDQNITRSYLPSGTDISKLFQSIKEYEVYMATEAQKAGMESINIGFCNAGLDTAADLGYWQDNIAAIRKVFSGYISYTSDWRDDSKVLDLVDFRILNFLPNLSNQHVSSVPELMLKYFSPEGEQQDLVSYFKSLAAKIDQPIVLLSRISAVTKYPGDFASAWLPWAGDPIPSWAEKYLTENPDYTNQINQYRALFEIIGDQLSSEINGLVTPEYAPWAESVYYSSTSDAQSKNYYAWQKTGSFLNWNLNPEAYKVIGGYASAQWGTHSIHLGTTSSDYLTGSDKNDQFVWRGGSDNYQGLSGSDTVIISDLQSNWKLTESQSQKFLSRNDIVLSLNDIEYVKFLDSLVALTVSETIKAKPVVETWNSGYATNVGCPGSDGTFQFVSIKGKTHFKEIMTGTSGFDTLVGTDNGDAFFLHDHVTEFPDGKPQARIVGIESIQSGAGDDMIDMTSDIYMYGSVSLDGGQGDDFLWANAGDDVLIGGAGMDQLWGGPGKDSFVLNYLDKDTICDFRSGTDRLLLDRTVFTRLGADVTKNFAGSRLSQDADDYLVYNQGTLYYDKDANGPDIGIALVGLIGSPQFYVSDIAIL